MNYFWKKKSQEEINVKIFDALANNISYRNENILGTPASYLDRKVFNTEASFVKDAPFLCTLIQNPNHIGCHTLGKSESFFKGTQAIETELLDICAVDILKGEKKQHDGYVASGGTEANIQAIWTYRNYYINKLGAKRKDICLICTEDSHYSMAKAANLLVLDFLKIPVTKNTRKITKKGIEKTINKAQKNGKKYFIVVCNMMTTMFGSIDDITLLVKTLQKKSCKFKLHVDAAYGGFYYPFANHESKLTFQNPAITSFTLDAHKMAQAPYGTGIFIIRKGYMDNVNTSEASYVEGEDNTLIGSRSGANAIATWMILVKNGPFGWEEKIFILQKRTEWFAAKLTKLDIDYYRHAMSNIITIKAKFITPKVAKEFVLVPDNHKAPNWYKIVIMEHVTIEKLILLKKAIKASRK